MTMKTISKDEMMDAMNKASVAAQKAERERLRDYFAGQALAGHMASHSLAFHHIEPVAQHCYLMADAMLAARDGGQP